MPHHITNISILINFDGKFTGFAVSCILDIANFALHGNRSYGGIRVLWKLTSHFKCTILGVDD